MNERGLFSFFIVLALTLNFGFFLGDFDNPEHHHAWELGLAFVVSLIATILKFGDRTAMGAVFLSTSIVADFHMAIAIGIWTMHTVSGNAMTSDTMSSIVSMAGGALLANFASVALLIYETAIFRR